MRLTLRTLLAYLDNTLDPQEAEKLKEKLGESGFATQLVQRIRNSLHNGELSAPAPNAMGPVEEANVIGEYLDSTLPSEQVAEIERACLESDAHLAEAAACHQILTLVLGKPAEIPQELRQRIYDLPDRQIEDIAAGGSFSGVAIPPDPAPLQPIVDALPTSDVTDRREAERVQPVGPDDSGVSDAPTRLRQSEVGIPATAQDIAIAGGRPRSVDQDTRIYGGSIRPSRMAPWLVSLGLAAVLLFVLTRLFQPLFTSEVASVDDPASMELLEPNAAIGDAESTVDGTADAGDAGDASEGTDDGNQDDAEIDGVDNEVGDVAAVQGRDSQEGDAPSDDGETDAGETDAGGVPLAMPEAERAGGADAGIDVVDDVAIDDLEIGDVDSPDRAMPREAGEPTADGEKETAEIADGSPVPPPPASSGTVAGAASDSAPDANSLAAGTPAPPPPQPPMARDAEPNADQPVPPPEVDEDRVEVATATSENTLLAALVGGEWVRLSKGMSITDGTRIVSAPTFRSKVSTQGADITFIGPSQAEWDAQEEGGMVLRLEFGRMLITTTEPDVVVPISVGNETMELSFSEANSTAALGVMHFRTPGLNPLEAGNRIPVTGVMLVAGDVSVLSDGGEQKLELGQERRRRGNGDPEIAEVDSPPGWIDPPKAPFEESTREGLLSLLDDTQPLELRLREATMFRRSEVAALAGRTMLALGKAEVYFGGDGLLSEPQQRTYWPDHYASILAVVDRSAESAEEVHDQIVRMDSANATSLLRLLTGYSQRQLVEGGDAQLVELLDSPAMAVRVLALENLHKITGTTLYFRADQENAIRRASVIKKWETKQRKGDIRWPE